MDLSPKGIFWWAVVLSIGAGCSRAPIQPEVTDRTDPKAALTQLCSSGKQVLAAKGTVWLKAKSKEANGQFPAMVKATAPSELRLEVTNMLGGTEAIISVSGKDYSIDVSRQKSQSQKGSNSWGGIPLRWATDLFLGKVPCPTEENLKDAKVSISPEGALIVETARSLEGESERFAYHFGAPERGLPETLHWEKIGGIPAQVEFRFDDPEDETHSPKKWEAKSAQGEVKVRWRDRSISLH